MSRKNIPTIGKILGVGERIRKIRGGLTQAALADILGVKANALCRYEKGRIPDEGILNKIAEYGNTTVDWILRGETPLIPRVREISPEEDVSAPHPLETALLTAAIVKVEEVIKSRRLKLSPDRKARLIVKVYEECHAVHKSPSTVHVERLLLLRD